MKSHPDEIEAIFQLHKQQGGGWIKQEDITERVELIRSQRKLPPLPPLLPPLPPLPLPALPPLPLPPLPKVTI